jgi:ElaB/YqjD/DUF883 family membrane-anchored ribosome-binding protein
MGEVAEAARAAAQRLDQSVPQLANLIRSAGDRVDEFSRDIRGQSARELAATVSDFARRRPAVVFGMAAAIGFLGFRLLNAGAQGALESVGGTDWRPDPHSGGSAYPVAGSPAGSSGTYPGGSTPASGTGPTAGVSTYPGATSSYPPGGPGGSSTYPGVTPEPSPSISPTPGRVP